jgi:hypothetical protein
MGDAALDLYADDLEGNEFQNNVSLQKLFETKKKIKMPYFFSSCQIKWNFLKNRYFARCLIFTDFL